MDPEIELLRNNSKNINDFLCDITDNKKYNTSQIYANLKNCLVGKTANIYSCGPSFNDYKDKLPVDDNTIKICVKGTYNIVENADILIFDNRIKAGYRVDDKYELHNKFKIFTGDYYFNNFKDWINNLPPVYKYPLNEVAFQTANLIFSPDKTVVPHLDMKQCGMEDISFVTNIDNASNIIYGNYNISVPLIYRLLELFDYMGIKKFNITGYDLINPDCSQQHYFDKDKSNPNFVGYDTVIMQFYDYLLDYSKYDIVLYSDKSNANINIPRHKKMDLSYHFENKIKNTDLSLPDIITNPKHILFLQLIHYLAKNRVKCDRDCLSTPIDQIIQLLIKNTLPITYENIITYVLDATKLIKLYKS